MSEAVNCPKCGATIPPEAPQGLCPKCLLSQASFPTETGFGTRHSRPLPPPRDELARAFPHLEILELIGQGGMGFVFKARQPKLDRLVALKILAQPLAEQTLFAERFTREGRTLAKLSHPNIVTIHDFGQAGPFFYLLMEYVDGVNLRQAMRAGAVNPAQALAIVPKICEALQYAHNEGVLHRDIKPDNILLDTRGRVKIADFGIAKLMAEAAADNPLTGAGASLGTPHYMAPEQIERPNAVDHRADIFSLGVVFYEMLTGELPLGRFAAPSQKGNDPRLDDVVLQTLEKQPERRPQSAEEVRTKVENIATKPGERPAGESAVTFKMSPCFISTPEFLQTWIGRQLRFTGKGEIRLDAENLIFAPRGQNWIVVPLRAIIGLTVGELPTLVANRKLISITFTERGIPHRILLTPTHGAFRSVWNTNEQVQEWFNAIRYAVKAATGRTPPSSPDDLNPLAETPATQFAAARLKGIVTIIFAIIATLFFLLVGSLIVYSLLHANPPSATVSEIPQPSPTNSAHSSSPPPAIKQISALDASRNGRTIRLRAKADLTPNEILSPLVRYGSNTYGPSDAAHTAFTYHWPINEIERTFSWTLPESFAPDFDAVMALQALSKWTNQTIQFADNGIVEVFASTNAQKQGFGGGLYYRKDGPKQTPDPFATVTLSEIRYAFFDVGAVAVKFRSSEYYYWRVVPTFRFEDGSLGATMVRSFDDPRNDNEREARWFFSGATPTQMGRPRSDVPTIALKDTGEIQKQINVLQNINPRLSVGAPLRIFTIKDGDRIGSAYLELQPAFGKPETNPASAVSTEYQNVLEQLKTLRKKDEDLRKLYTSEAVIVKEHQKMIVEAEAQKKRLEEGFRTSSFDRQAPRLVEFDWSRSGPQKLSLYLKTTTPFYGGESLEAVRKLGAPNKEEFDWDFGQSQSRVVITRDPNKYSIFRDFQSLLPANFSPEYDLEPAVERFKSKYSHEPFPLFPNQSTPLLKVTNTTVMHARATLGLRFTQPTNFVEPQKALATIRGFQQVGPRGSFRFSVANLPAGYRVEAISWLDKNEGKAVTSYLSGNEGNFTETYWDIPDGFNDPERWSGRPDFYVSVKTPFEVFVLTNKAGQIFRARLALLDTRPALFEPSQIVLSEDTLFIEGETTVAPNEKLRLITLHSDGTEEEHPTTVFPATAGPKHVSSSWKIPEDLRPNALTIRSQLQAKFLRRQIALEPGGNFTLVNLGGDQVLALQFVRTPAPPQ